MNLFKFFAAIFVFTMLASCTREDRVTRTSPLLANVPDRATTDQSGGADDLRTALGSGSPDRRRLGTDNFLGESNASGGGARNMVDITEEGEITLNLIEVPIEEAARAVLSDALGKNLYQSNGFFSGRSGVSWQHPKLY